MYKDNRSEKLEGFTDESRYLSMFRNRPKASIVPLPNTRILAQRTGTSMVFVLGTIAIFGGLFYNQYRELLSWKVYTTRKRFTFKSDPYSGNVNCTFEEVPYKQSGY